MYTPEYLKTHNVWVRCTSPEQGRIIGKLRSPEDWNHDFQEYNEFLIYISGHSGWNPTDCYDWPIIEFSEVQLDDIINYQIY